VIVRSLMAILLALAFLPAVATAEAHADPLSYGDLQPADGLVRTASSYPNATDAQMFDWVIETSSVPAQQYVKVEVATQTEPRGQDGTFADDFTVDTYLLDSSDAYPQRFRARTQTYDAWLSKPGTYYWQAYYTRYDFSAGCSPCIDATPVRTITIQPQPESQACKNLTVRTSPADGATFAPSAGPFPIRFYTNKTGAVAQYIWITDPSGQIIDAQPPGALSDGSFAASLRGSKGIAWYARPGTYFAWAIGGGYNDTNPDGSIKRCDLGVGFWPASPIRVVIATPTPAARAADPRFMTAAQARSYVKRIIRNRTHHTPVIDRYGCTRSSSSTFGCNARWHDTRKAYRATFRLTDLGSTISYSVRGRRASRSCVTRRSFRQCATTFRW
jgi:hypothetical protein